MKTPDQIIRCLLVQPEFPPNSFWNYKTVVEALGAKTPNMPLGLITVAAILPQHWEFKLVDLNCEALSDKDLDWADLVCSGGMLPQQKSLKDVIARARARGKFIAIGGADPTSQPEVYQDADAMVLDEGEATIPLWLKSWSEGSPAGTFRAVEKPDMTQSPIPRYDLVNINYYNQMALQISRGCPFNCEFCDIIVLYGRKPRIKTPDQVVNELNAIRSTGYAGSVDIVDDNFIGNKRYIRKEILPVIRKWNRSRLRPFFFATEASMNLADDVPLMKEMAMAGFRIVFMGIETPDPKLLLSTQKSQNTVRPIQDRVRKVLENGILPTGGFIMGFDGESSRMYEAIIKCIEESPIGIAMAGLLVALPNTQLTNRLRREGRLLGFDGRLIAKDSKENASNVDTSIFEVADQTVAGLNFITTRSRKQIYTEYRNLIHTIYDPKVYFDRALRQIKLLKLKPKRIPRFWELKRDIRALCVLSWRMTKNPETRRLYWRNFFWGLFLGPNQFDMGQRLAGMYLHLGQQRNYVVAKMDTLIGLKIDIQDQVDASYRRSTTKVAEADAGKDQTAS